MGLMTKYGPKKARQFADLYQTPVQVTEALLARMNCGPGRYFEPFAGEGKICQAIKTAGGQVTAYDVKDYGPHIDRVVDFFSLEEFPDFDFLISNPPYGKGNGLVIPIIERILRLRPANSFVALLLPAEFGSRVSAQAIMHDHPNFHGKVAVLDRIRWFDNKPGMEWHAWYCWGPARAFKFYDRIRVRW